MPEPEFYDQQRAPTTRDFTHDSRPGVLSARAPMRRNRRFLGFAMLAIGLFWLAALVLSSGPWLRGIGGSGMLIEQTYTARALAMDVSLGSVEVRSWAGPGVRVEATYHGGGPDNYAVQIAPAGDTLRITGGGKPCLLVCPPRDIEYRISLPASGDAQIKTGNGAIDVADLNGQIVLNSTSGAIQAQHLGGGLSAGTVSGAIELDDIAGAIDLHSTSGAITLDSGHATGAQVETTSGAIELSGVAGDMQLKSISGAITVRDAAAHALTASTVSGAIDYEGSLARGAAQSFSSVSGDITLSLPESSAFDLRATTISGDIDSEFELAPREAGRRSLSGTAGGGGATLTIETTSSAISVDQQ